jgi:PAS domain-containing protein
LANGHGEVSGRPDHPAWSELVIHVESQSGRNPLAADLSAARAADAQLRMIIDTIPVLAWCNLPDGSNEFLNQRWQHYTGLSRQEACGWDGKPPSIPTTSAR